MDRKSGQSERSGLSRRQLLSGIAIGALVVGFEPISRTWVTAAQAATTPSFNNVPALDGAIYFDSDTRTAHSYDQGNIVQQMPAAVLRPGSVDDIAKMIQYCRQRGIKVAPQGGGQGRPNSVFGHGLVSGGLVIELRWLNTIHSIGPDGAYVDAGVQWNDLIKAAYAEGLTPPSITGYTQLSVGGTLSIGGLGAWSTNRAGAQVDHTQQVQVVTGSGAITEASMDKNSELFQAVLGGLGQCGVITRAKVDLVPAKELARTYRIPYTDISMFFSDIRTLINRTSEQDTFDVVINVCAPGTASPLSLWATIFYNTGSTPNTDTLLAGLSPAAKAAPFTDSNYLDYIFQVDSIYDSFKATANWEAKVKPWINLQLPDDAVEQFVKSIVPTLTPEDIGPTGFLLVWPNLRSSFTRPLVRVPSAGKWVWTFGILTDSADPGPNPTFASKMTARNKKLYDTAYALGATRYPEDAIPFTTTDWKNHYGSTWPAFNNWKMKYDPSNILTPGSGIFGQ